MYFYYLQKSRNVIFSGTVLDYLFIYVFLLFPEVQKCYVFRHCALSKTVSFWNRDHNVLNKYKYCEQILFCLFCFLFSFLKQVREPATVPKQAVDGVSMVWSSAPCTATEGELMIDLGLLDREGGFRSDSARSSEVSSGASSSKMPALPPASASSPTVIWQIPPPPHSPSAPYL